MSVEFKAFNVRIPKELWLFLKHEAFNKETSMNQILMECLAKYKKKIENKLTKE